MVIGVALVKRVDAIFSRGERDGEDATALRDAVAEQTAADAATLAGLFVVGYLTLKHFRAKLYVLTRNAAIAQYALGRGGMAALTDADLATLGEIIGKQATYLLAFTADIRTGTLTDEQVAARAALYPGEAGVEAHSRGLAAAMGVDPPEHPPAHVLCRCSLRYDTEDGATVVYWQTAGDDHVCPICTDLAATYSPWRPAA